MQKLKIILCCFMPILVGCDSELADKRSVNEEHFRTSSPVLASVDIIEMGDNKYPFLKILSEGDYFEVKSCARQDNQCTGFKTRQKKVVIPLKAQQHITTYVKSCTEDLNNPDACSQPYKFSSPPIEQEAFNYSIHTNLLKMLNLEQELLDFKIELLSIFDLYEDKVTSCNEHNPHYKPIISYQDLFKIRGFSEQDLGNFVSEFDEKISENQEESPKDDIDENDKNNDTINHILYGIIGVSAGVTTFTNSTKLKHKSKIVRSSATIMVIAAITRTALAIRESFQLVEEICEANSWLIESINKMNKKWEQIKINVLDYGRDLEMIVE